MKYTEVKYQEQIDILIEREVKFFTKRLVTFLTN